MLKVFKNSCMISSPLPQTGIPFCHHHHPPARKIGERGESAFWNSSAVAAAVVCQEERGGRFVTRGFSSFLSCVLFDDGERKDGSAWEKYEMRDFKNFA